MSFKNPDGNDITPTHPGDRTALPTFGSAASVAVDDGDFEAIEGVTAQEVLASIDDQLA